MTSVSKTRATAAKKRAPVTKAKPAAAKTKPKTNLSAKRVKTPIVAKASNKASKAPVKTTAKKAGVMTKVSPIKKPASPTKSGAAKNSNHKKPALPVIEEKIVAAVVSPSPPRVPLPLFVEEDLIGEVGHDMGPLPNDEVFDETDGAQHLNLRELADVQRRARLMNRPETHPDFDGHHCVDCDKEIPKERLALQRVRCVDCQQDLENLARKQQARGR